jgi:hypothetical protein
MNIPLDHLYHWVEGLAQRPVILYVFRPHGSKDIFDLNIFKNYDNNSAMIPDMICYDQEPLNFSEYQFDHNMDRLVKLIKHYNQNDKNLAVLTSDWLRFYSRLDRYPKFKPTWLNAFYDAKDWTILLHSEWNSEDVEQFSQNGFCPAYYWSHAMIARDWYRFAQHDVRLKHKQIEKTFLVYCRDWTPNREYRLKFMELLLNADLLNQCNISTQHVNNQGVHLCDYQVQNPQFAVDAHRLLAIPDNNTAASASADYDTVDITTTAISVVLETVFDTSKIHLTEKILRPIACGHPFVLAAGPGALAYLRRYGFQTFGSVFDESYDGETDCIKRMEKIIKTMQQIQNLTAADWQEINRISEYNRQHFFSDEFMNQVSQELQHNLNQAVNFCYENLGDTFWRYRKIWRAGNKLSSEFKSEYMKRSIRQLRQHRLSRSQNNSSPVIGQ